MSQNNVFWDYSLSLYAKPGIEAWCLGLQDSYGANVNVVLFCCYVGTSGTQLSAKMLADVDKRIQLWDQEIITPLRDVRRRLKDTPLPGDPQVVGGIVKQAEHAAEKQLQNLLFHWWREHANGGRSDPKAAVRHNLEHYLALLGRVCPPASRAPPLSETVENVVIEAALRTATEVLS